MEPDSLYRKHGGCKYRLNHARVQQSLTGAEFEKYSNEIT